MTIVFSILYSIGVRIESNPLHHIFSDTQRHMEQGLDVLRFDPMSRTDPVVFQLHIVSLAKLTLKIPELVAFYTIPTGNNHTLDLVSLYARAWHCKHKITH